MKQLFCCAFMVMTAASHCFAQKAIKKGEPVPAIILPLTLNDSSYTVPLDVYRGKLVLLDFWSVHCLDCIVAMPEMVALQKKFAGKLQVILVTHNTRKDVLKLWNKFSGVPVNKEAAWIKASHSLPMITSDSLLLPMFPHEGVPAHTWISPEGKLIATSYSTTTNEKNIEAMLAGRDVALDEISLLHINHRNPLSWFTDNPELLPTVSSYSFFMPHIEYGQGGSYAAYFTHDSITNAVNGISMLNCSKLELYKFAYQSFFRSSIPENFILLPPGNNHDFYFSAAQEASMRWINEHTFCYGLKIPDADSAVLLASMQKDLDRFFHLESRIEKKKVDCLAFSDKNLQDELKSKGMPSKAEKFYRDSIQWQRLQNVKMKELFYEINSIVYPQNKFTQLLDESSYTGTIDIELPVEQMRQLQTIKEINDFLQRWGLSVTSVSCEKRVLVISQQ